MCLMRLAYIKVEALGGFRDGGAASSRCGLDLRL
jgi:hypothetical protein